MCHCCEVESAARIVCHRVGHFGSTSEAEEIVRRNDTKAYEQVALLYLIST